VCQSKKELGNHVRCGHSSLGFIADLSGINDNLFEIQLFELLAKSYFSTLRHAAKHPPLARLNEKQDDRFEHRHAN
jgi:hypothetical protein